MGIHEGNFFNCNRKCFNKLMNSSECFTLAVKHSFSNLNINFFPYPSFSTQYGLFKYL